MIIEWGRSALRNRGPGSEFLVNFLSRCESGVAAFLARFWPVLVWVRVRVSVGVGVGLGLGLRLRLDPTGKRFLARTISRQRADDPGRICHKALLSRVKLGARFMKELCSTISRSSPKRRRGPLSGARICLLRTGQRTAPRSCTHVGSSPAACE